MNSSKLIIMAEFPMMELSAASITVDRCFTHVTEITLWE